MKKRLLFLTGNPGVGKTTVLLRTIEALKAEDCSVGGMISREVRTCGTRVGFEILDLTTHVKGWLAHVNQKLGPRVGKYRVNLKDLNNIGVGAIVKAVENSDIIVIDEVGPMELHSENFKDAVRKAVESGKLVIGTIHWRVRDRLIEMIKMREDTEIFKVTLENRENLQEVIVKKALKFLKRR